MDSTVEATDLPPLGDIPLMLDEPLHRRVDFTLSGIQVGLITLRAWVIRSLPRTPDGFEGLTGYLIRLGYDLEVRPDAPPPSWFELGFAFGTHGTTVADALPHQLDAPDGPRLYVLNGHLMFARQEMRVAETLISDIQLPAVSSRIQLRGVPGPEVGWRHLDAVDPVAHVGSHTGWISVLAPSEQPQVQVFASARFALPAEETDGLQETAWPDAFTIDLPPKGPADRMVTAHRATTGGPRVFVSYAWEADRAHGDAVAALSDLLEAAGVNVEIDRKPSGRQDWNRWMTTSILRSDYVIVVASPTYGAAGRYELNDSTHTGVQAEYTLLMDQIHENRSGWTRKILPVVLPGRAINEIPLGLQPHDADYYEIDTLDAGGVAKLLTVIQTGHPHPAG